MENLPDLNDLSTQRQAIEARQGFIERRLKEIDAEIVEHKASLRVAAPWWKILLRLGLRNTKLRELEKSFSEFTGYAANLKRQLKQNEESFESGKHRRRHIRKRLAEALKHREAARQRAAEKDSKSGRFREGCQQEIESDYERTRFVIRKQDYRRGNALDNYFRNQIIDKVIAVFDSACVYCHGRDDLTLDHYAIPKNEGGNFALLVTSDGSLKLNVIVLCRSCNAAKGQIHYLDFFSGNEVDTINRQHKKLLELILNDHECLGILRRWYGYQLDSLW